MKYTEVKRGRTFVLRLEDGEVLHETIEQFAVSRNITAATVIVVGAAAGGSKLVVGPTDNDTRPVVPMEHELPEGHEIVGTGTLFPNLEGEPILHVHIACGRNDQTVTGCVRGGVRAWQVMEIVMDELLDCHSQRRPHDELGFEVLHP